MKIALRAANGCYITAEDGGGIDGRVDGRVALRANRVELGPWETFDLEKVDVSHVTLKTCEGFYVTAEGGGGSFTRTNETSAGPWETFTMTSPMGLLGTWDQVHVLTVDVGPDPVVVATQTWQGFSIEVLEQPVPPPAPADLRLWRGSFCIPDALHGIPYGDGKRIWTPAYGCYDEVWRSKMREAYRARGYTHFVYNCAGLPYANDYPELADDGDRVRRDLIELREAGLIPVVCATDDRNPWVLCESFVVNTDLIPICFPVWEMNGPLGNPDKAIEEQNCKDAILRTRDAASAADCYLHFTPGHGSISYASEIGGWQWCQDHGTVGLLGQGGNKISNVDPIYEGKGFETTACRLAGMVGYVVPDWDGGAVPPAWEGMNQLSVKFEWGIYESYHSHVTEADLNAFTDQFMTVALHVCGFCDGGS